MPLHVIVDEKDVHPHLRYALDEEKLCAKRRVPLSLLLDEDRSVAEALEMERSPVFYLLDRRGNVVEEGQPREPGDYWEALAAVRAGR
jgi:hypothetical protein